MSPIFNNYVMKTWSPKGPGCENARYYCGILTHCLGSELGFLKSRSYFGPSLQNSDAATSIPILILPVYPAFSMACISRSKPTYTGDTYDWLYKWGMKFNPHCSRNLNYLLKVCIKVKWWQPPTTSLVLEIKSLKLKSSELSLTGRKEGHVNLRSCWECLERIHPHLPRCRRLVRIWPW